MLQLFWYQCMKGGKNQNSNYNDNGKYGREEMANLSQIQKGKMSN